MTIYRIDDQWVFDGKAERVGSILNINAVPPTAKAAKINGKTVPFNNGVCRVPAAYIVQGLNVITIDNNVCESAYVNHDVVGDYITPYHFDARDVLPAVAKIAELEKKIAELEKKLADSTIDVFI